LPEARPTDARYRLLIHQPCSVKHLFRPRADADIAREIAPADNTCAVDEELGGTGDIAAASDPVFVEDAIACDGLSLRIGEQREGVAGLVAEVARLFGRVDADRNRLDAGGAEIGEMLFDTP
jgi:hypothetical protein